MLFCLHCIKLSLCGTKTYGAMFLLKHFKQHILMLQLKMYNTVVRRSFCNYTVCRFDQASQTNYCACWDKFVTVEMIFDFLKADIYSGCSPFPKHLCLLLLGSGVNVLNTVSFSAVVALYTNATDH